MLDLATVRNLVLIGLGVLGISACSKAPTHAQTVTQARAADPSRMTHAKPITADELMAVVEEPKGPTEEFGEAQAGSGGFAKLPPRIGALFEADQASNPEPPVDTAADPEDSEESEDEDRGCAPIGKALELPPGDRRLWEITSTGTDCMGSGGQRMWLVLDDPAQPPRVVLDTGVANEVRLDMKTRHHDLPDAWVVNQSNCCGRGEGIYRFDGTEYREVSEQLGGSLEQLMLNPVASPGIPGVAPKPGCELTESPMRSRLVSATDQQSNVGLRWVELNCEQLPYSTVWLIRRTAGDSAPAVQILAKEELLNAPDEEFPKMLDSDVVLWSEPGTTAEDVLFPHAAHGPVRWHLEGEELTRISATSPPPANP